MCSQFAWIRLIMTTKETLPCGSIKSIKQSWDNWYNWDAKNWEYQVKNTAKKNLGNIISEFKDIQWQKLKKQHFPGLPRTFPDIWNIHRYARSFHNVVTMMFKKGIYLHIQIKLVDDEPVRNLLDKATNPHKFLGKTSFHLYHWKKKIPSSKDLRLNSGLLSWSSGKVLLDRL